MPPSKAAGSASASGAPATVSPPPGRGDDYPNARDVAALREAVEARHPGAAGLFATTWTAEYLRTVMSQPSREDRAVMRSFGYSAEKLAKAYEH
eukprot:CAMPEP_0114489548 /NCGR_PEP_ID=MMETSP0109-20121206/1951_1 /TAXON_ID=29199 /ORGANISM="Chlorarachnion reptans, Strain CCCM449" /LENGTH=93 /DNA_ID=CAMNT_0001666073 /DNA_START=142 /DNA_END=420 /DNA_ORIENTATION=-